MLIKLLNYFGVFAGESTDRPYSYTKDEYLELNSEHIKVHRDFLKSIEAEENARLSLIESKTSQIVSQTGIVLSLLSLFVPIFIEKISDKCCGVKIVFMLMLSLSYVLYVLAIHNAIKNYNLKKFRYSRPSPENVIKHQNNTVDNFFVVEIKDLLYSINENVFFNNKKATNLIYAYNSFRFGNVFIAVLGVFLCGLLMFDAPEKKSVEIDRPIELQHFDSIMDVLIKTISIKNKDAYFVSDSTKLK